MNTEKKCIKESLLAVEPSHISRTMTLIFQVSETLVEERSTILPPDIPSFGITEVDIAV